MTYLRTDVGRKTIDLRKFAHDLAKALDAQSVINGNYPDDNQTIKFNDSADVLELTANHREARVTVRIIAADIPFGDRPYTNDTMRTQGATVSVDRGIERIAADVRKRVIDASQQALAAQRDYAKQQAANRDGIVQEVQRLKAFAPYLDIRHEKFEQQAVVYSGGDSVYLNATLHHDGTVSVQRLGSLSGEKFRALLTALNTPAR